MARRKTTATASPDVTAATSAEGLSLVCAPAEGLPGDPVEAFVGDDLIGTATLRPAAPGGGLSARLEILDAPVLTFPAHLRIVNARRLTEIGTGLALADAAALIAAAGPPRVSAAFAGLHPAGVAFAVTIDRLPLYPRRFALQFGANEPVSATSVPGPTGSPHSVVFPLAGPLAPDTSFQVSEAQFDIVALSGRFEAAELLGAALAQMARLTGEVAALQESQAALRRRFDVMLDLGRDDLLLGRLDLFYLLLCERIDRATATTRPATSPGTAPALRRFGPADVDGIGIFDVETDGRNEWRWFGPDATIALRDIDFPVRRVVLYFHGFGDATEPPCVRVSLGGPAEPVTLRSLEGRYAVDVPVSRATAALEGMLIVHLSFDRHQTSAADPRLLSAVFSGAEVFAAPA